jgi:hypothetical protein
MQAKAFAFDTGPRITIVSLAWRAPTMFAKCPDDIYDKIPEFVTLSEQEYLRQVSVVQAERLGKFVSCQWGPLGTQLLDCFCSLLSNVLQESAGYFVRRSGGKGAR